LVRKSSTRPDSVVGVLRISSVAARSSEVKLRRSSGSADDTPVADVPTNSSRAPWAGAS